MGVTTKDLLSIAQKALQENGIQATGVCIIYSEKADRYWKVNIVYKKSVGGAPPLPPPLWWPSWALLLVDAETGELLGFKEGYQWR